MRLSNKIKASSFCSVVALLFATATSPVANAQTNAAPPFEAVYKLLQENAAGVNAEELNAAAVRGLLAELDGRASIVTNGTADAPNGTNLLAQTNLFDGSYAYLRFGHVGAGLSGKTAEQVKQFASTNKIKGVILDLRFADGSDYAEAGKTADLFVNKDQPLLHWGSGSYSATAKNTALSVPSAILVNSRTRGAAEALAAALREAKVGLIIGAPSAGQASVFKEFPLPNGQTLRVASSQVKVGDGRPLDTKGLQPDIKLSVSLEDERAYLQDPYQTISRQIDQVSLTLNTNDTASVDTNRSRARINEAELVRRKREGLSEEEFGEAPSTAAPEIRVIRDPALARAIDLLKGLAVIQATRGN